MATVSATMQAAGVSKSGEVEMQDGISAALSKSARYTGNQPDSQTTAATVSATTVELFTGAAWPESASETILWTRMATVSVTTMQSAGETDAADEQQELLCGANRRQAGPLNGIPILFDGSA